MQVKNTPGHTLWPGVFCVLRLSGFCWHILLQVAVEFV